MLFAFCLLSFSARLLSQYDTAAYYRYIESHKKISADQLLQEYPSGQYLDSLKLDYWNAEFFDQVQNQFQLTKDEKDIIHRNGFMVSERLKYDGYRAAFLDVYKKDLPLYISSDAILHALHRSYDNILRDVETDLLCKDLFTLLFRMRQQLAILPYVNYNSEHQALLDADVYLTTAMRLLKDTVKTPIFLENTERVNTYVNLIMRYQPATVTMFSSKPREVDFSQFKPRGHYDDQWGVLQRYFRAMMWLGRIELYLTAPQSVPPVPLEDVRRQCMMSVVLAHAAKPSTLTLETYDRIENIIAAFVGQQDNLSLRQLIAICNRLSLIVPSNLQDSTTFAAFQEAVVSNGGDQKILSQILVQGNTPILPAATFMLFGQRYLIDSYVLGNVVFDKTRLSRMMPSPLDVMFSMGNDATAQLLYPEIKHYDYAENLAQVRYLVNIQQPEFWNSSVYNNWLASIRSLNPPAERGKFPLFMQTGAWWQKTLNAQLASWAELRHDNILYAKQSYTGISICFYPKGFVEPVPEFYEKVKAAAKQLGTTLHQQSYSKQSINAWLSIMDTTCTLLSSMARKELAEEAFSEEETSLIKNWIVKYKSDGCVKIDYYDGWYPYMMYGAEQQIEATDDPNLIIADVHTQPADEDGNIVGNVLHVGTGYINMAVIIADNKKEECMTAYAGPVGSYYERIEKNYKRLTDDDWKKDNTHFITRPNWVHTYLASAKGERQSKESTLFVTNANLPPGITLGYTLDNSTLCGPGMLRLAYTGDAVDSLRWELNNGSFLYRSAKTKDSLIINIPGVYDLQLYGYKRGKAYKAKKDNVLTMTMMNTTVDKSTKGLQANADSATTSFQWLNCSEQYHAIANATSAFFTPKTSGLYAVELRQNGCVDTSECYNYSVKVVGVEESTQEMQTRLHPNPTNGIAELDIQGLVGMNTEATLSIFDLRGRKLRSQSCTALDKVQIDLRPFANGVYIVEVHTAIGNHYLRITKQE